ncbi:KPN_02809 family neutral zinc metallopeptidase [Woeseia oceani]|uniref:Flagellar biosynthesis protein FlgM n=1 Tax=Woeseia oceani TaxID=1548547 RepID=A0A193LKR4_9GAMM|nr:neutral zinc metallopeptidase [Woeseia oceani]ANO53155.1 flagellar biosynthesis protein FlgM [Woeseia oceani]
MRWKGRRRSTNVEDRRGASRGGKLLGGGIGTIVVILFAAYTGIDPSLLMQGLEVVNSSSQSSQPLPDDLQNDPTANRVAVVLADTEEVWSRIFDSGGQTYQPPTLVLFTGSTRSACGLGQAAMGPFYCPADRKAYIDLSFFEDLRDRFGAPGDFAQAYVLAHEVAHHVQNLLGVSGRVRELQQQGRNQAEVNQLSVRLELQADCFSGVWANRAEQMFGILEDGDLEEALNAATAIGDDRLQRQSRGSVAPDSFTHGTSAQRKRWFKAGFDTGDPDACDTFSSVAP